MKKKKVVALERGPMDEHIDFSADHYGLAIPKNNLVDELAIDAARRHRQQPRRNVANREALQP
jgi:hypothetical protein